MHSYLETFEETISVEKLEADIFQCVTIGDLVNFKWIERPAVNILNFSQRIANLTRDMSSMQCKKHNLMKENAENAV